MLDKIPNWKFRPHKSFKFLEEEHEYHLMSERLWSPSSAFVHLKYVNLDYYKDEDRYRGSYVHWVTRLIDEGDPEIWKKIDPKYLGYVEGYCEFKEVWKYRPRFREIPIYHPDRHYGVTPDGEGTILGGEDAIVEAKTGYMQWWTATQTAAQDLALRAWSKKPKDWFRRRFGVELKANGKFRVKEFDDDEDYDLWLANLKSCRRFGQPPRKTAPLIGI